MNHDKLLVLAAFSFYALAPQAASAARQIIVGGDITGTFNLGSLENSGIEGNRVFFDRVRDGASNIVIYGNSFNSYSQDNLVDFYSQIGGVSVNVVSGQITERVLESSGLFILQFPKFTLNAGEIATINNFVRGGGNLLLLGEFRDAGTVYPGDTIPEGTIANGILNELLAGVGSTIRLANDFTGGVGRFITTDIVATPFMTGITSFGYGAVSSVTGGQALIQAPTGYDGLEVATFFAMEQMESGGFVEVPPMGGTVPEPSSWAMMILGFGVIGVSLRRRKLATS